MFALVNPMQGEVLPRDVRVFMEDCFGEDFRDVRIHRGPAARWLTRRVGARAFAVGRHIVLADDGCGIEHEDERRLLAHELVHIVQGRHHPQLPLAIEPPDGSAELEALLVAERVVRGLPAGRIGERHAGIACTWTSDRISHELSYALNDWSVTSAEEKTILGLLRADHSINQTIKDLDKKNMLFALVDRIDDQENRLALLQVCGAKITDHSALSLMEANIKGMMFQEGQMVFAGNYLYLFNLSHDLHKNLRTLGGVTASSGISTSKYSHLIGKKGDAFTGGGATGYDPHRLGIGAADKALLALKNAATVNTYSNPIPGSLPGYLATLSARERKDQATLLLKRAIISIVPESYVQGLPSRAGIMKLAGKKHRLEPALVAGFVLAEQRDQSQYEDAKDLIAAISIMEGNTSIGLGQVVVSTATRGDLFQDLLTPGTRKSLSHKKIAHLLTSDEFNIFAVARYIRYVADAAAKLDISKLPNTQTKFPGIDLKSYTKHSKDWSDDNIKALGSEYTSKAWDDKLSPGWGSFVFEAYKDVKASGVF